MKIENTPAGVGSIGSVKPESIESPPIAPSAQGRGTAPAARADEVTLSSGVQLAGAAVKAAADAPETRADQVARAKALLEAGQVGNDVYRLADALIDRAISGD
jgi:flagellar biosynthesis anti-sigma factor FlgM